MSTNSDVCGISQTTGGKRWKSERRQGKQTRNLIEEKHKYPERRDRKEKVQNKKPGRGVSTFTTTLMPTFLALPALHLVETKCCFFEGEASGMWTLALFELQNEP